MAFDALPRKAKVWPSVSRRSEVFVSLVGDGIVYERLRNGLTAVSPDVVPFDMAGKRAGQLHINNWNITLDTSGIHYQCSGKGACDALHIIGFK